jgi:thimet oligopeptidase
MRGFTVLAGLMVWAGSIGATPPPAVQAEVDRFLADPAMLLSDAAAIKTRCDATETLAKRIRADLEARKGAAAIDTDFATYDALGNLVSSVAGEAYLVSQVNPAKPVRDAAQACSESLSAVATDIGLSRPIYDRLSAIPTTGLDANIAFTLNKALLDYRLAGVDRDAATRDRVAALNKEITEIGLAFDRNISEDKSEVTFASAADLAGLPQDYIDAHKPGADGLIHITTSYPDVFPIFDYADREETRKKLYFAFANRAHPVNDAVLAKLVAKREELAKLLGFPNYAALITKDKMIGSPERARTFLDEVNVAAKAGAEADTAKLLARYKLLDPRATALNPWSTAYLSRLVRKEQYDVDSALVRQYFTLDKARTGIFELMGDLFGADIRPWNTKVWADGVTAWELYDGNRLVGRFYLDMSPRDGKFSHAAQFTVRNGLEGRQVPIAALVCNFPATGPMDHDDVTTFLHEFGHLIHTLYSGRQDYASQSMNALQWDFIEAPSQLLEEWTWDYDTLKTFASNDKGEPIPAALVAKMNAGRRFGEATGWKRQLGYAAVSLGYYDRPAGFDLGQVFRSQYDHYAMVPEPTEAHQYASFGHLNGYSAIYYTYVWSKGISLDLLTRFKAAGIRDKATAMAYRKAVLEAGGSKPADQLIKDFLGRPTNTDAFREELTPKS